MIRKIEKKDLTKIIETGFCERKWAAEFLESLGNRSWSQNGSGLIKWLFDQNLGVIAESDDGKILGYMVFISPLDGFFGICDGAFSPLGGNWVSADLSEKDRFNVMSKMVEKSLEFLVSKEITSVAICQNVADKEIIESLVLNGFGIRCSDAMMEVKNGKLEIKRQPDKDVVYENLDFENIDMIRPLFEQLENHLEKSPCFFSKDKNVFEQWKEKHGASVIVARVNGKIAGYIAYEDDGENFISCSSEVMNICGMFVCNEYRGKGIADGLTAVAYELAQKKDFKFLGVDYETINPTALHFWTKYFVPYTYSFHRRIDERVLNVFP